MPVSKIPSSPLSSYDHERVVTLESSDKVEYHLFAHQCLPSRLIQDAIDNDEEDIDIYRDYSNASLNSDCNPPSTLIPLVNVSSDCLAHVVRFMKHYAVEPLHPIKLHPHPNPSGTSATNASLIRDGVIDDIITQEWYRRFIKEMSKEMIFQIVNAANYMDIPSLLNLSCLKVSVDLMDKSAEDIRKVLNLPKMTEEEERRARDEHSWIFEGN